ncbi:ribonuclease III family protein [Nostoc sp. PCC 7107]|uniref:ribonuclease III family protein n=1 Tax=Nostoc sp. PCC 7107 TaxID=317936 RepID=UPI00029ECF81|nr:ribonuclease III domain-containing protein [Nostoc sp. PCC 7107]AFY43062.1 RNAse III [Nostoc sp. PCC 7107]
MNDQDLARWFQIKFGFIPNDLSKYRMAITTRQYEVLEFFGDSILGFVVADYLVRNFSIDQPGWFTEVKSKLVEDRNLSKIAQSINLASIITIPSTSRREQITDRVLADVLEAIIGAIYLDQGLDKCKQIIFRLWSLDRIRNSSLIRNHVHPDISNNLNIENPISTLQELLAQYGISPPTYTDIDRAGRDHAPIFTIRATCTFRGRYLTADGDGNSKREAKKKAAEKLLLLVLRE